MSDIDNSHARDPMTQLPEPVQQAVEGAQDKKALDIVVLDLRGSAAFTDFFVVCSGHHRRQVKAIVDGIETRLRLLRTKPAHVEGYDRAEWVLMDFFDFVVHVFTPDTRTFYALERLWGSAERIAVDHHEPA